MSVKRVPLYDKCTLLIQMIAVCKYYNRICSGFVVASIYNIVFICLQYADSTQVLVTSSNAGSVSFLNVAFGGPSNQIAKVF